VAAEAGGQGHILAKALKYLRLVLAGILWMSPVHRLLIINSAIHAIVRRG